MTTDFAGTSVRRARRADAGALGALEAQCFGEPWSAASLDAELAPDHGRGWIIEADGELAAALVGYQLFEELHIHRVAVLPALRQRGLGRRVLDQALEEARATGASVALLELRADNTAAIALYRAAGFEVYGNRRRYYSDGTDAILMQKALS